MVVWDFAALREDLHQIGPSNAGNGLDVIQFIDAAIATHCLADYLVYLDSSCFHLRNGMLVGSCDVNWIIELHRGRLIHMSYYFGGVPWTGYPNRALTVSQFLWSAATLVSSGDLNLGDQRLTAFHHATRQVFAAICCGLDMRAHQGKLDTSLTHLATTAILIGQKRTPRLTPRVHWVISKKRRTRPLLDQINNVGFSLPGETCYHNRKQLVMYEKLTRRASSDAKTLERAADASSYSGRSLDVAAISSIERAAIIYLFFADRGAFVYVCICVFPVFVFCVKHWLSVGGGSFCIQH